MAARPSTTERVFDVISVMALVMIVGVVAFHWGDLPDRIPRHFGITGKPDRWGGKGSLLILPFAALVASGLLTFAGRNQSMINLPMTVDRDDPEVQAVLRSMAGCLKAVLLLVFLYLTIASVLTAAGQAQGLGRAFLPVSMAAVFGSLIYYLRRLNSIGS